MDRKALMLAMLNECIPKRVLLRALMIAFALSVVSLLQILPEADEVMTRPITGDECAVNLSFLGPFLFSGTKLFSFSFVKPVLDSFESMQCKKNVNLTVNVVRELLDMRLLSYDAKALCIGQRSASAILALRELGFSNVRGIYRLPFFSLKHKKLVYELDYVDGSFDFVVSRDLEKVAVPALLVLEIERVLKPGGIGAMLVGTSGSNSNDLIRSVTPVSSLLKDSSVVHVGHVGELALVVFKRNVENSLNFNQDILPADCQSVVTNKPYVDFMEPLIDEKPTEFEKRDVLYLPKFVDVSSRKRLVYINIGAAEHLNASTTNWFFPSYPVDRKAFKVYFVDHNTSVMISYVKTPGVTFIYHPGLAGTKARVNPEDLNPFVEDDSFEFLAWFKETVRFADFVVLKMNASDAGLKFLSELFSTGTICFVDELFLHCSGRPVCKDVFKSLRGSGVFVHQWWGN